MFGSFVPGVAHVAIILSMSQVNLALPCWQCWWNIIPPPWAWRLLILDGKARGKAMGRQRRHGKVEVCWKSAGSLSLERSNYLQSFKRCGSNFARVCEGVHRRGAETWGFHESPSYPHMYCFLAWRERMESSTEKTLRWNKIVIGDFLNLGSVSCECLQY